jgi:osmoprotectant transport system ATP-binding protein
MIELRNVTRHFGETTAVDDISLTIGSGEVCVLVGSSGCGKSTTLRMINRLLPRSQGDILVDNEDIRHMDARTLRLNMGYVIQGTGLFPHWSVARNIAMVPRLLKWNKEATHRRVDELLTLLGLEPATYAGKYPHQLSGGEAQRVGVARALAADPNILLMDEPFGALDAITRETLQLEVLRIQKQMHKTIVFVTHDIDEALRLATRIAVMDQGRILQYDTPETILRQPASEFVEQLIGWQDRGLRLLALRTVREMMTLHQASRPARPDVLAVRENDNIRVALSLMAWQSLPQVAVVNDKGEETGLLTHQQVLGVSA